MALHSRRALLELTAILDNASVAIVFTQLRTIQRCNRRTAEIFGYDSSTDLSGRPIAVLHPDAASDARLAAEAGPLLAAGKYFHGDWLLRRADGTAVWCNLYGKALDPARPEHGSVWIIEDVTEARRVAEAQHRTAREMEAIMTNAPVGVFFTRERRLVRYNAKVAEIMGFGGAGGVGLHTRSFFRSEGEYEALGAEVGALLSHGRAFQKELFLRRADGSDVWVNLVAYVQNLDDTGEGTIWLLEDRTAVLRAEQALRHASAEQRRTLEEMEAIMKNASIGIVVTRDRRMVRYNARFAEMYGFRGDEAMGAPGRSIYRSDEEYEAFGRLAGPSLSRGQPVQAELFMRRRDGVDLWVNLRGYVQDPASPRDGTVWLLEDRTAVKLAEDALERVHAEHRLILDHSVVGIAFVRDRLVQRCNRRLYELYGYQGSELQGASTRTLFPSNEAHAAACAAIEGALGRGEAFVEEVMMRDADAGPLWVRITGRALDSSRLDAGSIWNFEDITARRTAEDALRRSRDELEARVKERTTELVAQIGQRRRAEERLRHLALHDGLTGLANRNLLRQRMAKAVEEVMARRQLGAVLFIDIDRFKNVNDTLGHRVGDALLKVVAERITRAVRSGDIVARLGGDEFVVVAFAVEKREQALAIAQKIHASLQRPVNLRQHELFATPSIGIALFPSDGTSPDLLVQKADSAMYHAKSSGRNAICFFDPAMAATTERYLRTESSLRRGIERGELETYYQPIVDLQSGACVALELLVRWRHPELGLLLPREFLPVAEDSGLVARIGEVVLEAACRQYRAWKVAGLEVPRLALNLSAQQFRDGRHTEAIVRSLAAHGIEPSQVELEITETSLMADGEQTLTILQSLEAAGFVLSVDDFGTGYSSLAYLKRFPVAKLKIDKSFIQDMTNDPNDEAIVRMIIALAKTLRIATVGEGVETAAQRDALRRLGCDCAQGYLFARAVSAGEIESRFLALKARSPSPSAPARRPCR